MNIYQKLAKITAEITKVGKNLSVQAGKSSYKAVGEGDVLNAVKPLEEKYGVYSYPYKRDIVDANILNKTKTFIDKKTGNTEITESPQLFMRIKTTYRFVNIDNPEEYVDIDTYGDGVDTQDKSPGKAMTYADKYALLKGYKVTTGDDPDQNGSEELGKKNLSPQDGGGSDSTTTTEEPSTAPTAEQLAALKKIKRSLADVAKNAGIAEKDVTAKHITDYIQKVIDYQQQRAAEKEAAAEKKAQQRFGNNGETDE